jgi:serine/threonine protein kinase
VLLKVEQAELENPSPRKVLPDRTIHLSYTMPITSGEPVISDFGAARLGEPGQKHSGDVMPGVYRAPEMIVGMEWDSKIDIWSVGVMVCIMWSRAARSLHFCYTFGRLTSDHGYRSGTCSKGVVYSTP